MTDLVQPTVELIAWTAFAVPPSVREDYAIDGSEDGITGDGQDLAEFAGRACYQSWDRPNPNTATVDGYLGHILEVRHLSVLEHAYASFYFAGVSRSLTHELVRHRHFNYSQLSQRYVDGSDSPHILPPEAVGDEEATAILETAFDAAADYYDQLVRHFENKLETVPGLSKTDRRKRARQAARAVSPNGIETRLVVTGNYRAWRHFLDMRAAMPADVEIRRLAVAVWRELDRIAPAAFGDYELQRDPEGGEYLASPNSEVS